MLDANLIFDGSLPTTPQGAITGAAITNSAPSTNVLDLGVAGDRGGGVFNYLMLNVQVITAFTAAGAATLQVSFQGSTDNATWNDILLSPVVGKANLVPGAKLFRVAWPTEQLNDTSLVGCRYYRLNYTVGTGPFTAGSLFSYVSGLGDQQEFIAFPRNFNVGA